MDFFFSLNFQNRKEFEKKEVCLMNKKGRETNSYQAPLTSYLLILT